MEKTAGGGPEVKQQLEAIKHDTKRPWDRLGVALRPRANNKDVDLLLEVEVTESLLEAMSADAESADSKNSLVEVTIIRPPEAGIIKSAQAEHMERKKMERKRVLEDKLKEIKAKLATLADDSEQDERETDVKPAVREAEVNASNCKIEVKPDLVPRNDTDLRPLLQSEPLAIKGQDATVSPLPVTKIDPAKRVGKSVVRGDVKNSMTKSASANEPQPAGNVFHRNAFTGKSVAESQPGDGLLENRNVEVSQQNIASTMPEQYRLLWASMKNLEAQLIHIGQAAGIETRPPDMETHADGSHILQNYEVFKNEEESQRSVPGERGEMVYNLQTDSPKTYFERERAPKEIHSSQNPTNEALQRRSCVEKAMEYHMEQRSMESIGNTLNLTNKRSTSRVSLIEEFIRHTSYEGRPAARPLPSREEQKQESCEQSYSKTTPKQHDFCGMMDCIATDNRKIPNTQSKTISSRERLMIYSANEGNRPVTNSRQTEPASEPDEEEYIDIVQQYNNESESMTGQSFTDGSGTYVNAGSSAVQVDIVVNDKYLSRLARDMQETYVGENAQRPERVLPRKGCGVTAEYSDVPEKQQQHRIMSSTKAVRDISVNTDTPSVINQLYHDISEQERSQFESIGVQTSVHPGSTSMCHNKRSSAGKSWADDRTQKFLLYNYQDVPDPSSDFKEETTSLDKRTCDPNVKRMKGHSPIQAEKSQRITMKDGTGKIRDRNSEERNRNNETSRQSLRSHSRESSQKDNRKGNRGLYSYKRGDNQRPVTSASFRSTDRPQKSEKNKRSSDDPSENQRGSTHTYTIGSSDRLLSSRSNQDITVMDYIPNSDHCSQITGRSKAVNHLGNTVICYNCAQRGKLISERVPSMYGCETECQSKDSHLEEQTVRKHKEEKRGDSQMKESLRDEYQVLNPDEEERTEKLTAITNLSQQIVPEVQDITSAAESNHCLTVTYGSTTDSHTSVLVMPEESSRAASREVLHDPTRHNCADGGDVSLPPLPSGWSQLVDTVHGCIWTWDGKTLSPGFDLKAGVEKLLIDHLEQKSRKSEEEHVGNNMANLTRISQEVEQELRSKLCEYNKAFMDNETLTRLIDLKNELKKPTSPICAQNHIVHTAQIDAPHFPVNRVIDRLEKSTVVHYDSSQVENNNSSFIPEIQSAQNLERRTQNQPPSVDENTSPTTQIRSPTLLNVEPQLSKQNTHKCQKYSSQDVFKKPQHSPVRDHPSQVNESPTRTVSETVKERCSAKDMEVKPERKLCHQEYVALTGPASIGRHSPLSDINASGGESSLHVTYLNPWIKDWTTQSENDPPMDCNKSRLRTEKVHAKSLESTISSTIEKKNQFRSDWAMSRCTEKKSEHPKPINDKSVVRPDTACETTKPSAERVPRPNMSTKFIKTSSKCSISQRSFTGSKSSLGSLKCSSKLSLSSTKSKSDNPKKCIVGKVKNYHSNGDIEIEIELSYRDLEKLLIQRQKQKRKRLSSVAVENGRSKVLVSGSGRVRTTEEEKQTLNDVEKLSG